MDSRPETMKHIKSVQRYMGIMIGHLEKRAEVHDQSKLVSPEVEYFDEHTEKLSKLTFGTDEYNESLDAIKVALKHHYANNSHHPERFENGINGMTLCDVVEMFCDWKAASERHVDGDIVKSIDHCQKRFGFSDDLRAIFLNSVKELQC